VETIMAQAARKQTAETTMQTDRAQVEKNYATFKARLRDLLDNHAGKQALLHDGDLIEIFDTLSDAVKFGNVRFGAGNYSIQEITNRPAELGWYAHAMHNPAV
jgi:hypothetical protein